MSELSLWTNDFDFVISETEEIAQQIINKFWGCDPDEDEIKWWALNLDSKFTYRNDDGTNTTKTVKEWIEIKGKGYFACSEY